MGSFDEIDLRLLEALQTDASRSTQDIASSIGLSHNACWRRVKRLEGEGLIRARVALLDEKLLGVGVTVFVGFRTNQHSDDWLERFASGVKRIPEVVELYRMSGDVDYLAKVLVRDIGEYDLVYRRLIQVAELHDVSSSFAMERIKHTTAIPLPDAE
ncbi:MAG: Lrp/AsnC family transcriptional regulator [Myxococcota bacterium]|nr:Lrp/AsnC family transcriptional regulator [Myxococcota bacterium]